MKLRSQFLLLLVTFCVTGSMVLFLFYMRTVSQRGLALKVLRSELVSEIEQELKWITQVNLQELNRQLRTLPSQAEKIDRIREVLADLYFFDDKSGYFFVYDQQGITVALPPAPQTHGQNRIGLQDANGVYFVRELIAAANRGEDFVVYHYPKPNGTEPLPKLAYSTRIPGTEFMIGTGVYIDDVDEKVAQTQRIQSSSGKAIEGIEEMAGTIHEIDQIANTIAATVEEQSSTTTEIAKLTQRVADSLQSLSQDIEGIAGSAREVAGTAEHAGALAENTAADASTADENARQLQSIAQQLREVTDQFVV